MVEVLDLGFGLFRLGGHQPRKAFEESHNDDFGKKNPLKKKASIFVQGFGNLYFSSLNCRSEMGSSIVLRYTLVSMMVILALRTPEIQGQSIPSTNFAPPQVQAGLK
ncbi:hypothetical protein Prudu_001754 [Prunus dulcis]|uniref:Uncharacterized protein n=1 Tax=Prunus dulcis TaxID=3755 RepID=A0A4Y1QP74_PRUDU|nr:hypothetical protein Prudu_001754 [Prunus dulcis]